MKKRLISLGLTIVMLLSVMLTSCSSSSGSSEEDIANEASRYTTTLNMYVVAEEGTTPEAAAAVAEQINKITKAKFKTQLNIYFSTSEEEHFAIIDGKIEEIEAAIEAEAAEKKRLKQLAKEAKARGETLATTEAETTSDETTEEETIINEWGLSDLKYPEEGERQLDIIFISGRDRYMDYVEREVISRLDDELSSSSKKLKDYINPLFFDAVSVYDSVYAIPNNHMIGEYTYLLVNKELAAKYSYDPTEFKTVADCAEFVADIAKYEPNVTPVCGELSLTNVKYFALDEDTLGFVNEPSVMAAYISPSAGYSDRITFRNIFTTSQLSTQMTTIQAFKDKGYIKEDADPSETFGIAVMKGNGGLAQTYGAEYEMIVLENPMATEESLYEGMFAVTQYTKDLTRSMEIITYLNTNSELRNLFQYGIENVNYVINEDGTLTRLNNEYMMDLAKTGNAFVAYPEEGLPTDIWEIAKLQNLDARLDPLHGFTFVDTDLDMGMVKDVAELSEDIYKRMESCTNSEELLAFLDTAASEVQDNESMTLATSIIKSDKSPNYIYNEWYNTNWPPED